MLLVLLVATVAAVTTVAPSVQATETSSRPGIGRSVMR